MEAAAASGDASAVIHLLPRVFEFVFAQMEEIKRDSANAHIRLIAPYLARHGAAYERAKFEVCRYMMFTRVSSASCVALTTQSCFAREPTEWGKLSVVSHSYSTI